MAYLKPTEEQLNILRSLKTETPHILVSAYAGTGKTATLKMLAEQINIMEPHAQILYLVFNSAMKVEAERKFYDIRNITVQTAHSHALSLFNQVVPGFTPKNNLASNIIYAEMQRFKHKRHVIKGKQGIYQVMHDMLTRGRYSVEMFENFWRDQLKTCSSELTDPHAGIGKLRGILLRGNHILTNERLTVFVRSYKEHEKKKWYTHNMYLKQACLSKKTAKRYTYILFDEVQDANGFMLDVVLRTPAKKKYFVGDPNQAIYGFTGCVNAFDLVEGDTYELSKSFRFNQNLANYSNQLLAGFGRTLDLVGAKPADDKELDYSKRTVIFRTNAGMLDYAVKTLAKYRDLKIRLILPTASGQSAGRVENTFRDALYFMHCMYTERNDYAKVEELRKTYGTIRATHLFEQIDVYRQTHNASMEQTLFALQGSLDESILRLWKLWGLFGTSMIEAVSLLNKALCEHSPDLTLTLTTAHKSKGREWDIVIIGEDDWFLQKNTMMSRENFIQEVNLAYVAATRAKRALDPTQLNEALERLPERFRHAIDMHDILDEDSKPSYDFTDDIDYIKETDNVRTSEEQEREQTNKTTATIS